MASASTSTIWRPIFLAYALTLTTATHWPKLVLGPRIPASDKLIHLLAFAALTFLLWKTKWIRRLWIVFVIAVAWAALDETSQGIPILQRWVSAHDLLANVLGVGVATAWIWALAGERVTANRSMRGRLLAAIWPVVVVVLGTALAFIVIAGSTWAHAYAIRRQLPTWHPLSYPTWFRHMPRDVKQVVDLSWLLIVGAVAVGVYRARLNRLADGHVRCVACGYDLSNTPTVDGAGRCGECGVGFRRGG